MGDQRKGGQKILRWAVHFRYSSSDATPSENLEGYLVGYMNVSLNLVLRTATASRTGDHMTSPRVWRAGAESASVAILTTASKEESKKRRRPWRSQNARPGL